MSDEHKLTEFIPGACFGYYDEKFEECLACKAKDSCQTATNSENRDEIRKIAKTDPDLVYRLIRKYRPKKEESDESFQKQELF